MSLKYGIGPVLLIVALIQSTCFGFQDTKQSSSSSRAPEESQESITIPFNWKKGDVRHYRITQSSRELKKGRSIARGSSYSDVRIEVTEVNANEVLVKWKMGATIVPNSRPGKLANQMNQVYDGLEIKAKIDGDGVYQGVTNWDEVDAANQKSLKLLRQTYDTIELPEDQKQRVWSSVMKRAGTRSAIELKMTTALQLLVTMTNTETATNEVEQTDSETSYMGKSLPGKESYEVSNVDATRKLATILWKRTADPEKSQPIAEEAVMAMAKDMGKTPPKPGFMNGFVFENQASFVVDLATGWPIRIKSENKTGTQASAVIKTVLIERIKNEE